MKARWLSGETARPLWHLVLCSALLAGCATSGNELRTDEESAALIPDKVATFLMFEGRAEEAMNFYISLFDDSRIESIQRYGPEGPGAEGTVVQATFTLAGRTCMAIDSPASHNFTFTPSISLFVTCESEAELDRLFAALSEGGQVMMPPGDYGFSARFTWCADRFGVSWQLNWPGPPTP